MLQADARIERPTRNRHEWELHAHIATSFLIGWGGIPWEFLLGKSLQVADFAVLTPLQCSFAAPTGWILIKLTGDIVGDLVPNPRYFHHD